MQRESLKRVSSFLPPVASPGLGRVSVINIQGSQKALHILIKGMCANLPLESPSPILCLTGCVLYNLCTEASTVTIALVTP